MTSLTFHVVLRYVAKQEKPSCDATCIATRLALNDQIRALLGETAFAKYRSINLQLAQNYKNTHTAAGAQPPPAAQKSKAGSSSTGGSANKIGIAERVYQATPNFGIFS